MSPAVLQTLRIPPPAALEFGAPLVAWGALAAGVPVLIHLVLRPRTRKQILPTMRFLMQAHQQANRMHRLKRFLLLACRVAVILLLVALLMRPAWRPQDAAAAGGPVHPAGLPVSAVLAFDNSASMGYRFQGQTRLAWAVAHARSLLADTSRFPEGSQIAIVTGGPHEIPPTWMEPASAPRYINRLAPADHDLSALRLLERSYAMMRHARHSVREVYLLTDLARHGWTGTMPEPPADLSGVYVINVGRADSPNIQMDWPQVLTPMVPTSRPSELTIRVVSTGKAGGLAAIGPGVDHQLSLEIDGQRRGIQTLPALEPGSEMEVVVPVPPLDRGAHRIALRLEPEDALACDNHRFTILSAGPTPRVLLVGDESASQVPRLLRAMIAPAAQPAHHHRFELETVAPNGWESGLASGPFVVLLADLPTISTQQWAAAEAYIRAGGAMLIVPGSRVSSTGYAGSNLLPAPILGVELLDPPLSLAATDLSHPYLRPFEAGDVDSINLPHAYRRLRLGPLLPGSRILVPFADGQPALLERTLDGGRLLLLAISPDREWGQYGTQAAPFLVLLQEILNELAPRPQGSGSYSAGQIVSLTITQANLTELFHVGGPSAATVPVSGGRATVPTAVAGTYRLCADAGCREPLLTYSVNVRESESDLTMMTEEELLARLPAGRTLIVQDPAVLREYTSGSRSGFQLMIPIALGLLVLMLAESLFANRFYGRQRAV